MDTKTKTKPKPKPKTKIIEKTKKRIINLNRILFLFFLLFFSKQSFAENPWSISSANPITRETILMPQKSIRPPESVSDMLIHFYRQYFSRIDGETCRFHPTCSQYTGQAIKKYGLIKGALMGTDRLLRCHPGSNAAVFDPVKDYEN